MPGMRRREFVSLLGGAAAMAVRGACAAAVDAGDRVLHSHIAWHVRGIVLRAFQQGLKDLAMPKARM